MSKKRNKKDDYKLAKILLITAIMSLIEKMLDIIILIIKNWGR
ncbi:hypothetical protein [Peptostreptococcus porci]|nr:hypothetical protein [Peptostreptococcus porci]MDY5436528.1 hypothetical protein [Peptostreptococcus porci]